LVSVFSNFEKQPRFWFGFLGFIFTVRFDWCLIHVIEPVPLR